jgi:RNA polymerase sigma-70 factor (ECF subfamily)
MERPMGNGPYTPAETPSPLGSIDAEGDQLESYRARLRIFAARRLNDWTAAEDVAQETLGKVLEALRAGRVRNLDALPGYLFQTATRLCLHRIRSASRERKAFQRVAASVEQMPGVESPLTALISEEERSRLLQALEGLEAEDREVLELTFRDELDSAEIGRRLGSTAGAVCVRRHRAIRRLAKILSVMKGKDRDLGD